MGETALKLNKEADGQLKYSIYPPIWVYIGITLDSRTIYGYHKDQRKSVQMTHLKYTEKKTHIVLIYLIRTFTKN